MPTGFSLDTADMHLFLKEFQRLTDKSDEVVIASAAVDMCVLATNYIDSARSSEIQSFSASRSMNWKNIPYGKGKNSRPRMFFAQAASKGNKEYYSRVQSKVKRRNVSRGFIKAHFLAAADRLRFQFSHIRKFQKLDAPIPASLIKSSKDRIKIESGLHRFRKFIRFTISVRKTHSKSKKQLEKRMEKALMRGAARASSIMFENALRKYGQDLRRAAA